VWINSARIVLVLVVVIVLDLVPFPFRGTATNGIDYEHEGDDESGKSSPDCICRFVFAENPWHSANTQRGHKDAIMELGIQHLNSQELEAGLDEILQSPKDAGALRLIVRRPQADTRETLEEAELDLAQGLVGDDWKARGSRRTPDGGPHPEMQLTLMNARAIALVAREKERWALAGDQLYVDLDLSSSNVPPGTRLAIGSAVIEVTAPPHTGCKKFEARFGLEALRFFNSPLGKQLQLRGVHAKIIEPGKIRVGDVARKLMLA
jgi:MOSC domain-containing protein YiiM